MIIHPVSNYNCLSFIYCNVPDLFFLIVDIIDLFTIKFTVGLYINYFLL